MTRSWTALTIAIAASGWLPSCTAPSQNSAQERELEVFAAASLRNVAQELATAFKAENGGTLVFNFAGSNTLAQQILAAPRGQIFLSADRAWVDVLEERGAARAETRRRIFSNQLVLVASTRSPLAAPVSHLRDLAGLEFSGLVLAEPRGVPAGRYARAALEATPSSGSTLWQLVASRVVPTPDVGAALALVESATDLLGIVYRTDADASSGVRILCEIEPLPEQQVAYWAVAAQRGPFELGNRFLDFLVGPVAQRIVARHGFVPLN